MTTTADKRATFRALHETGCFVIPNPWDVGSAVALQSLGFKAVASTSAGMGWAMGRADGAVTRDEVLAHLAALAAATAIPLNADFEGGFADDPDAVAANVALCAETGVAGLSIEDSTGDAAAHAALAGKGVLLTARSEGFIRGRPDLEETVRRLTAFSEAGADVLYAPGLSTEIEIATVIRAVAPKPVNVLAPGLSVATLADLGARRISVGASLARTAWGEFLRAAREIATTGEFGAFERGTKGGDLNALFAGWS